MKILLARILARFLARLRAPARDEVAHWINWGRS